MTKMSAVRRCAEVEEAEHYANNIRLHRAGRLANEEVAAHNRRIIERYGLTALRRIKKAAWAIVEGK